MSENRVKRAIDTDLSGLYTTAWQREQIVQYAMEGHSNVKYTSKMRVGLVLALVLTLMAVTAVAVGLTNYFDGFMGLEETYGDFEQWPGSAKARLVELMLESGALTAEDVPQWRNDLTGEEKEAAAEAILADYFDGMLYVDSYNVMERELGPIETWTDEQKAMLTELQEKHGMLTDSWPVFQMPAGGDLTRDQAVARAKEALLSTYSIDPDYLNNLTPIDALFRADAYNGLGLPADEPYWTVDIGYGMTGHWVNMRRNGDILTVSAPGTGDIYWGEGILDRATMATPGEHDATREEAIANARNSLTEILDIPFEEVDGLTATAHFFWHERYCLGDEPVWLVDWSEKGVLKYHVLLTYDARHIDAEPAGKQFDNVQTHEPHLDEIIGGMLDIDFRDLGTLRWASLEEKAAFCEQFKSVADAYAEEHPYFVSGGRAKYMEGWIYTRNVMGLPDGQSIDASRALGIALDAYESKYGSRPDTDPDTGIPPGVFYIVTNPDHPQWRFAHALFSAAVDARTGEVLRLYDRSEKDIDDIIMETID